MASEYWIIIDKPRFRFFPWIWRVKYYHGKEMDYQSACDFYVRIKAVQGKREFIQLGVTRGDGIQLLS